MNFVRGFFLLSSIVVSYPRWAYGAGDARDSGPPGSLDGKDKDRSLRGGVGDRVQRSALPRRYEDTRPLSLLDKKTKSEDSVTRVIVDCAAGEDSLACKDRILTTTSEGCLRLVHYLNTAHAYAVEIKTPHLDELEGMHEDPVRETMHIKESVQVHNGRDLQAGNDQRTPYGIDMVKAKEVWSRFQVKGENVRVCVMDTGVDRGHNDLDQLFGDTSNEFVTPWYRDSNGHGTHVTGTISASDNNLGVVGVAPNVEVFIVRVFTEDGQFFSSDMTAALEACKEGGSNIISMSLGGPYANAQEQATLKAFYEKDNIVSIAAVGNTGRYEFLYPASYEYVIGVAAVDSKGKHAYFSTRNTRVDVAAPGVRILSTWGNGSYATVDGTSMACPHVSGVVALMRSYDPSATPAQIFSALTSSAVNPSTSSSDTSLGHGIVDAVAAIEALSKGGDNGGDVRPTPPPTDGIVDDDGNGSDCEELQVIIQTDRYGSDTSHWLESDSGDVVFYQENLESFQTYKKTACIVPFGCYRYQIRDNFCDGINGEGLKIMYKNEIVFSGGRFGCGGFKDIGNGCN